MRPYGAVTTPVLYVAHSVAHWHGKQSHAHRGVNELYEGCVTDCQNGEYVWRLRFQYEPL